MSKAFTAATPRYKIEGVDGQFFDVFNKRKVAIKAAIEMAVEYPGTTFCVVKYVNLKKKVIFSLKIEADFSFDDIQDVYSGLVGVYQNKLDKTRYWRKPDVNS